MTMMGAKSCATPYIFMRLPSKHKGAFTFLTHARFEDNTVIVIEI